MFQLNMSKGLLDCVVCELLLWVLLDWLGVVLKGATKLPPNYCYGGNIC